MQITISGFAGMNNLRDKRRLSGPKLGKQSAPAECREIVNCDITDSLAAIRRQGHSLALAGAPHSLWSKPDETQAYFVDGTFKRLFAGSPYTAVSLRSLLAPSLPMSYAPINYLTACSNGIDLFLIQNGVASDFVFSSATFKEAVMAGHILACFNRRLYVAVDNALYYTDADNIEVLDERDDPFVFGSRINMILPLLTGMYVAADKVYWLAGKGPDEFFIQADHDLTAIEGTGVTIDGGLVGVPGNVAVFTAREGICMGGEDGEVTNLTLETLGFTPQQRGAALIRKGSELNQYISWV